MPELTWETYEFERHEKSANWYAALWIIAAALAVVAYIADNYLVIGLVIITALVVTLYGAKEPRKIKVSLDSDSLSINNQVLSYDELTSFWIFERQEEAILSIHRKGFTKPSLNLFMPHEYMARARLLLRPRVREEEHEESLIDAVADKLKF